MKKNKEKILKMYGNPSFDTGTGKKIVFARCDKDTANKIEDMTDEKLISTWKSLVLMNEIVGNISLGDLQEIDLLSAEITDRKIDSKPLKKWYENAEAKQEKYEESLCNCSAPIEEEENVCANCHKRLF
jgi:hypothetical protein